jgi:hypothetical protein
VKPDTDVHPIDSAHSMAGPRGRTTRVAVFTDNDFSKVNGVTTTLKALLRHAPADVQPRIYTLSDIGTDVPDYLALRAWGMPIPYYREMSIYAPRIAEFHRQLQRDQIDLIHLTTPGPVGLSARYLASHAKLTLVGSFHTHLADYARRLSGSEIAATVMRQGDGPVGGRQAPTDRRPVARPSADGLDSGRRRSDISAVAPFRQAQRTLARLRAPAGAVVRRPGLA